MIYGWGTTVLEIDRWSLGSMFRTRQWTLKSSIHGPQKFSQSPLLRELCLINANRRDGKVVFPIR